MNNHDVAHWGHSLKYLKWDDKKTLTASQKLISRTVHEWYDAKHPAVSHEELKMVNGLTIDHCPIVDQQKSSSTVAIRMELTATNVFHVIISFLR